MFLAASLTPSTSVSGSCVLSELSTTLSELWASTDFCVLCFYVCYSVPWNRGRSARTGETIGS